MTEQESEDAAESAEVQEEEGGPGCRSCAGSCLGILILFGLTFGLLSANASARLDAKVSEVSQEILDLQEAGDQRRSTILGAPANDQNAVADYNGFMWVMSPESGYPPSWRESPPPLPTDVEDMIRRVDPGRKGLDSVDTAFLSPAFEPNFSLEALEPSTKKRFLSSQKNFKRFRPLLRYIRDGLSRGRCDWQVNWEKGASLEIPNLLTVRGAANMLAYEATILPPRESIQNGLEIVAYGEDCGRHGTVIGSMIGVAIVHIGLKSVALSLSRPGLESSDYQRVIDTLAKYRSPSAEELLHAERVSVVVTLLQISGRYVDQSRRPEGNPLAGYGQGGDLGEILLGWDLTQSRELEGFERYHERGREIARLPRAERRRASERLDEEMQEEWFLIANNLNLNVHSFVDQLEMAEGMARVVRALAAAHQVRLQTGAFPTRIQALAGALGEGIEDPTSNNPPTPLGYRVDPPYLRCWLAGENGVDDGGPKLLLPRPKWTNKPKKKKRSKKRKRKKGKSTQPTGLAAVGGAGDDYGFQTRIPQPPAVAAPEEEPGKAPVEEEAREEPLTAPSEGR